MVRSVLHVVGCVIARFGSLPGSMHYKIMSHNFNVSSSPKHDNMSIYSITLCQRDVIEVCYFFAFFFLKGAVIVEVCGINKDREKTNLSWWYRKYRKL